MTAKGATRAPGPGLNDRRLADVLRRQVDTAGTHSGKGTSACSTGAAPASPFHPIGRMRL
jgi:hypothetical protein